MYEHWCLDQEEEYEKNRIHAISIGSFTNPEMAREMLDIDSGENYKSSDEDFEKSIAMVENYNKNKSAKKKRQKKLIQEKLKDNKKT